MDSRAPLKVATYIGLAAAVLGSVVPALETARASPAAALKAGDEERAFARTFPNQTEVTVRGLHFAQEDSPDEIGTALAEFVDRL